MVTFALPDAAGARSSALLLASLLLVVESWEGYLASVRDYPLKDRTRFIIDIILVFEYLLLMHLSVDTTDPTHYKFLVCICTIFVTYLVWDYFRILAYPTRYAVTSWIGAVVPFFRGLYIKNNAYKGPSITLCWLIYFLIIYKLADFTVVIRFWITIFATAYGIVMYRLDKAWRFRIPLKLVSTLVPIAILIAVRIMS